LMVTLVACREVAFLAKRLRPELKLRPERLDFSEPELFPRPARRQGLCNILN
jgi:hypothetical protein